jgi:hypothetical protein
MGGTITPWRMAVVKICSLPPGTPERRSVQTGVAVPRKATMPL